MFEMILGYFKKKKLSRRRVMTHVDANEMVLFLERLTNYALTRNKFLKKEGGLESN